MNKGMRSGKSSELIVAGQLLRLGLDVYLPSVDDQAIDLLIKVESNGEVTHAPNESLDASGGACFST